MVKTALVSVLFCAALITQAQASNAEFNLSLGYQAHSVSFDTGVAAIDEASNEDQSLHFGFVFKNRFGETRKNLIGIGVDVDEILGDRLIGYRALDYERELTSQFRIGAFIGAASLDTGLPQNGYYMGLNVSYRDLLVDSLGLMLELRHGSGLARDSVLDDDPRHPSEPRPDIFLDFTALALQFIWTF